jgi:hypothetical protein
MVYALFLLLLTYSPHHSAKIPYYNLAVFTMTLTKISYTKDKKNIFKIQNLFRGHTKTFEGPHAARRLKTLALHTKKSSWLH